MNDLTKLGAAVLVLILLVAAYFFVLPALQKPSKDAEAVNKVASLFKDSETDVNGVTVSLSSLTVSFEDNTLTKLESNLKNLSENKEIKSNENLDKLVSYYKDLIVLEKKQTALAEKVSLLMNEKLINACQELDEAEKLDEDILSLVLEATELNEKIDKLIVDKKIFKPFINVDALSKESQAFSSTYNKLFDTCLAASKAVEPLLELDRNAKT